MPPKISVVMPVWNGEKYLRAAIESVLAQSFTDFELIVVNDGSTDSTSEIVTSYADARVKHHRLEHGGIVTALNFGVSVAQAEWIVRQDADDVCHRERFATQWRAIWDDSQAVLCFCDVSLIGEGCAEIRRTRFPRTRALIALRLCYHCPIVHSSVLFRKDAFLRAGEYRAEERHAEDYALWGRMLELGGFIPLPNRLLDLRLHDESVSKGNLDAQIALTTRIAVEHCERFMRLTSEEARRAFGILVVPAHSRKSRDWWWFLSKCAPRLRWWSLELGAWLLLQTLKQIIPQKPAHK